jgi:hypothetical protein
MVRHEHVRESSKEGALQCQPAQKLQIGNVIAYLWQMEVQPPIDINLD